MPLKTTGNETPLAASGEAREHISLNEGLRSSRNPSPGKRGVELPPLDVPAVDPAAAALGKAFARDAIEGFPEVSEIETIRHFTRLSGWNYA